MTWLFIFYLAGVGFAFWIFEALAWENWQRNQHYYGDRRMIGEEPSFAEVAVQSLLWPLFVIFLLIFYIGVGVFSKRPSDK